MFWYYQWHIKPSDAYKLQTVEITFKSKLNALGF